LPRIFDNIESGLLPALRETLSLSQRGDFCVGYFNLRGWKSIDDLIENWSGKATEQCRLLVGMQRLPQDELRIGLGSASGDEALDNQSAARLKRKLAEEFRLQLMLGMPTNEDEAGLHRLSTQLKTGKVVVKLFLKHPLHAKLYLLFRLDPNNPITGFLGSSNLTLSGLSKQGELNVDVLDHDATTKLAKWFDDRWADRWCVDITAELIEAIEQSWAREITLDPYLIYVKIAYHLAQEARAGLNEFRIPPEFGKRLFAYQEAAVKIAAHHLNKRGGVLIGDVVGLGKTLMATALAKIFQDDHFTETLIICPKNLVKMWEDYVSEYRLLAKVLSVTRVTRELPELRRYRLVLIDESHNLRNREGRRYRAIQEYLTENESRCILLSATPYNKTYGDLSSQLRLFVPDDRDIGVRPERLLQDIGETEFVRRYQCPVRSLVAFEKSIYADDWRELIHASDGRGAALDKPRELPTEVAAGIAEMSARAQWNRAAPAEFGLPTEIWREVVARRTRYAEVRAKLVAGEVREINDLITLNLDIQQLAQDVIERCEGPDLLRAFWKAIESVTVLDPTCGSGAFLFAALNILEPLYETCLDRMEAFVADLERSAESHAPKRFEDFKTTLAKVSAHPNTRYFTLKSIILNNLFGVDIMEEAVEICKLRLFLKLAAQVDPDQRLENLGIEPLPDIDFNIRAGNTLVG
jgi:hypothetical protein